jgi:acyl-CoA thioester hydrolase
MTMSYCIDSRGMRQIIIGAPMPTSPRKLVHVERIAIRWGDMDAMGHVNNTVYFRYMEQARISWFDALVPEQEAWKSTGIVIANASCNFKRAMTYPGTVEVKVYTDAPGGSSVGTHYEMWVEGELYADGAAMVVFIDMQRQKATRIPESIRTRLQ